MVWWRCARYPQAGTPVLLLSARFLHRERNPVSPPIGTLSTWSFQPVVSGRPCPPLDRSERKEWRAGTPALLVYDCLADSRRGFARCKM